ncbi:hypothetical protein GQ651_02495 [Alphaproteobacteria bacterium GH1-50]|uniref:Type II secretion system protein GspE N-terminal domain-containing protein n=1 Tax=Kangsaoukella pontilimi TaxID=2691042 RepID=A0A7C9IED5_9RHOB|nr:hypothetical protein [Kangsaoukella pontilimi]MXQ06708.1 hypothetical protein [Kangsaoukella pontilimi]
MGNDLNEQRPDPRLVDLIGAGFIRKHGIVPLRRVGALTLVAAPDMWARLETVDRLEECLGPVTFVDLK